MSIADPPPRAVERKSRAKQALRIQRPNRQEALEAVRTLIRWAGDDPDREGLVGTPDRVVRSYAEFFSGYDDDPVALLQRTFEETDGYDEIVMLKDIRFESHCEHHIAPIIGKVHIAYLPNNRVVGISKLARLVEVYAKRLQIQEKMTAQIANTLDEVLQPKGVAVVIEAAHQCMTTRGVHKAGVSMVTSRILGVFRTDPFRLTRRENRLHARGSADMKGFIALVLALVPAMVERKLAVPLHLAFTHDEETGCFGAPALIGTLPVGQARPLLAIVGEPTSMQIANAQKGCSFFRTRIIGLDGHSSAPDRGVNAIVAAAEIIGEIGRLP